MAKDDNSNENSIISTDQLLPNKLTLIPLAGRPIFPGIFTPLMISSADDVKVVEEAYEKEGFVGIVMLKNEADSPTAADLHKVGTAARIIKKVNLPDGDYDGVVVLDLGERGVQLVQNVGVQGVQSLRSVDGDDGKTIVDFILDVLVHSDFLS